MKIRSLILAAGLLAGCAGPAGQEAPPAISFPHAIGRVDPFEIVLDRRNGVLSYDISCLGPRPYLSYNAEVTISAAAGGAAAGGGLASALGSPPQQCDPNSPLFEPQMIPGALLDGQYLNIKLEVTFADGSAEVLRRSYKQENGGLRVEQP